MFSSLCSRIHRSRIQTFRARFSFFLLVPSSSLATAVTCLLSLSLYTNARLWCLFQLSLCFLEAFSRENYSKAMLITVILMSFKVLSLITMMMIMMSMRHTIERFDSMEFAFDPSWMRWTIICLERGLILLWWWWWCFRDASMFSLLFSVTVTVSSVSRRLLPLWDWFLRCFLRFFYRHIRASTVLEDTLLLLRLACLSWVADRTCRVVLALFGLFYLFCGRLCPFVGVLFRQSFHVRASSSIRECWFCVGYVSEGVSVSRCFCFEVFLFRGVFSVKITFQDLMQGLADWLVFCCGYFDWMVVWSLNLVLSLWALVSAVIAVWNYIQSGAICLVNRIHPLCLLISLSLSMMNLSMKDSFVFAVSSWSQISLVWSSFCVCCILNYDSSEYLLFVSESPLWSLSCLHHNRDCLFFDIEGFSFKIIQALS